MSRSGRKFPITLLLIVLMLVLLPFLAYKQYEWLGRVSDNDREQMQASMRRSSAQFRDDFDREITRVYESFQTAPALDLKTAVLAQELRKDYRDLYLNWEQTAPYPKLVSDVYLVQGDVEHLDPATGKFESVDWPAELMDLRKATNMITFQFRGGAVPAEHTVAFQGSPLDPRIPAVVFSFAQVFGSLPTPAPLTRVVVKLNLDFIEKEFIPNLVRQHLTTGDGGPDYNVAVVDFSGPQRVIYASNGSKSVDVKGDINTAIFAARPSDFRGSVPRVLIRSSNEIFEKRIAGAQGQIRMEVLRDRGAAAGPITATGVLQSSDSSPTWQLVLQHPAGSVDAAVAQTRKRNLAISLSILLLLALSMALIVISSQRERRLARQQMEFVTAVSHELRTPLSVICSAGENLADGVVRDEEHTRQYGALVRNEGRRLADMVEQILDFAGIQSGQKTYKLEPTDVSDVVSRALQTFEMQLRDNGVAVEKRVAMGLPQVMGDSPSLVRAVQNLISNALKYGQAGNWLAVRAEASEESVNIIVEDHGPGISPIDLPHIFEPFYRGRSAIDGQIKGSGLGLSLVKQIVESHHAKISVHSDPAIGSSFTISLPRRGAVANVVSSHDQAYSSR